jgi:hypothetical protein
MRRILLQAERYLGTPTFVVREARLPKPSAHATVIV